MPPKDASSVALLTGADLGRSLCSPCRYGDRDNRWPLPVLHKPALPQRRKMNQILEQTEWQTHYPI